MATWAVRYNYRDGRSLLFKGGQVNFLTAQAENTLVLRNNMTVPIKIGVVGYGGSAKIYNLPYILPNPDLEVYAFLQRAPAPSNAASPERESHCTVDFPKAKHYQTAEDFFADKDIELVAISTHPDTHAKFAEAALHSGKHGTMVTQRKSYSTDNKFQLS